MSISASKQFLQIAKRNLSNFEENSVIPFRIKILRHLSALSTKFYTRNVRHASFSFEIRPAKLKTPSLGEFYEISVISFLVEILPRWSALSTLFYTPNVVHVDFSVETILANRKTQSFKFRRKICYLFLDWDTTAFQRSFHYILHAQCSACRIQCRNNPCQSQNAIFQISKKTLLFLSGLRYYGVKTLFPLHSTRRT
jgi:hypothetical protein